MNTIFPALCSLFLCFPAYSVAQISLDRNQIDQISMAVVQIHTPVSTGSGSLVEGTNLIYTNRHVVEGYYDFIIHALKDPTEPAEAIFNAELVGFSEDYDFAILRVNTDLNGAPINNPHQYINEVSSTNLYPKLNIAVLREIPGRGDQIAILGYPGIGDNELVFTTGIISSVQYDIYEGKRIPIWYRTNAEMSPGNSGGIATNSRGELLGIPSYVRTESRTGGRLGSLLSMHVVNAIVNSDALIDTWGMPIAESDNASNWDSNTLDFNIQPSYGETSLSAGFTPDPYRVSIVSGGSVDAIYLGGDCVGYAAQGPDYRLNWIGSSSELRIFFDADQLGDDTALIINKPDGSWACNDDANEETFNPMVIFPNPTEGRYDIWVSSYDDGDYIEGQLHITELDLDPSSEEMTSVSENLDFSLDPNYETIILSAGFNPDPNTFNAVAGGTIGVSDLNLGSMCTGFASSAPDFRLMWTGSTQNLRLFFEADQPGNDTVLLINTSNGEWICNDDAHRDTLNPMINLNGQPSGQFDIWIASYRSENYIQGKLTVTELDLSP